jgi:hypothetical protein
MQFTDIKERGFQKFTTNYLITEKRFVETTPTEFNREFCINTKQFLAFSALIDVHHRSITNDKR